MDITKELEKMVDRFWGNLENGLEVLLKQKAIFPDTTIKELQEVLKKEKKVKVTILF